MMHCILINRNKDNVMHNVTVRVFFSFSLVCFNEMNGRMNVARHICTFDVLNGYQIGSQSKSNELQFNEFVRSIFRNVESESEHTTIMSELLQREVS